MTTIALSLIIGLPSLPPTPPPTSIPEAMAYASAIDLELDVYLADSTFSQLERVQIRRVQNDLHMVDSKLMDTPYVDRVTRLVEDWNALVRLDRTLAKEKLA